MRAPAIPRATPAFLASLALHAAVLAFFALSRGAEPGQVEGRIGMAVEILTLAPSSERTDAEASAPPPEERPPVSRPVEEREKEPSPANVKTEARPPPARGPRVIGSTDSQHAMPDAGDETDPRPDVSASGHGRTEARAEAVGQRAQRRLHPKDGRNAVNHGEGDDPAASATGTSSATPGARRLASKGIASVQGHALPPALRDALVELLQRQVGRCYVAPGNASRGIVLPVIAMRLNRDGSLGADPRVSRSGQSPADTEIAQAALRAVRRCAPYSIPARFAPYYEDWRDISAEFEFLPD